MEELKVLSLIARPLVDPSSFLIAFRLPLEHPENKSLALAIDDVPPAFANHAPSISEAGLCRLLLLTFLLPTLMQAVVLLPISVVHPRLDV